MKRGFLLLLLVALFPVSAYAAASEVSCLFARVDVGDVRVYRKDLYVNWRVTSPCSITRTGVMLGRSPSSLRPIESPITDQPKGSMRYYSTFVTLDSALDEAWIAAYAVHENGTTITSRPRMVSGALVTLAPSTVRPPDATRIDSCHLVDVKLGVAPVVVDGVVSAYWAFGRSGVGVPCGLISETGVLIGPTPSKLRPAFKAENPRLGDFYVELPPPQGDTAWVVAYVIDVRGYEFRSPPEQIILRPSVRRYRVDERYGVEPIFEHDGVIWALAHETLDLNITRSAIIRRFPSGRWEVITTLFGEPLQWIRMVHVTPEEVVLVADERIYRWHATNETWSVRVADYTGYVLGQRLPVSPNFTWGGSLAEYQPRHLRLDSQRRLLVFDKGDMASPAESSGVYVLSSSGVEATVFLPQPTVADLKRYRPRDAGDYVRFWEGTGVGALQNKIGPHVLEDGKLWFGIRFYGGEGWTGIGGVGVFDPRNGRWSIHHHPLLIESSITALYPDGDVLWLGTLHFGEGSSSRTRGLVRYNRRTKRAVSYHPKNSGLCSWRITEIRRVGKELWVGVGSNGISVLDLAKGTWTNYAIEASSASPQVRSLGSKCTGVRAWPREN